MVEIIIPQVTKHNPLMLIAAALLLYLAWYFYEKARTLRLRMDRYG